MCFQGVNLMLPRKRALYADLLLYSPKVVSFHLCWSGISGCKTKPSTRSQMYKYSLSTCTDNAPLISATQHLLSKAWATVRCFTARLGISLHKFGASSDKVLPCNHLSNQNLVDFPLPTMVSTATLKSVLVFRGTWIGKPKNVMYLFFAPKTTGCRAPSLEFLGYEFQDHHTVGGAGHAPKTRDNFHHLLSPDPAKETPMHRLSIALITNLGKSITIIR